MVQLSILDQTAIPLGSTAQEELWNTTKLAQIAEKLGFYRYWVSEHHLETLGHSSPEVLIPHLLANTSTIRVGSGGVMLTHYSAYKVAENFRLLEALYPNRVDMGVGRAPGGIPLATSALQEHKQTYHDAYTEQIKDLIFYLSGSQDPNHRFRGLKAMPDIKTVPELWMLGSSGGSAGLAGSLGISYAYAQFISGQHGGTVVENYKQRFQPSNLRKKPASMVAFFLVCAETDEEAEMLASSIDLQFLQIAKGEKNAALLSPEQATKYSFSYLDKQIIHENRNKILVGSPQTIKKQLLRYSEEYQVEEFMLASMIYNFHAKVKSYQLLSEAFR
ncbi:LLM class flavin-dependent oxidoreductase [Aquibacillus rhizosphaerae]|uniref:LLM class flavin-dependent oxidoreductase n=1 Tax=Aquibacillus rhizosphaerae TaxID=3051431 RepID=A0ABT7L4Q4_9BACI|nr:LLM class flavin-dependent oxidoreductase [Aquibacillus sp. LR5S19]MDL4840170.1 LLM class flavin-dependent oxidoreductase [Aquibacillus sp. LR5S19]